MIPQIIFEDKYLLAINKPPRIVVNKAKTVSDDTIQSWFVNWFGGEKQLEKLCANESVWQHLINEDFSDKYGTPSEIFIQRQGIVHRLDKDTSGVLLLAKDPGTLVNLLKQFKERKISKKYLCLVHGKMRVESSVIRVPIARSTTDRHKFRADIDGKSSSTHYRVLRHYSPHDYSSIFQLDEGLTVAKFKKKLISYQQGFSLVECMPKTGRTHQIRVHMSHMGHPIVSDSVYGGEKRSSLDKLWCSRQFLHSSAISFLHPVSGEKMVIKADLFDDLQKIIDIFEKNNSNNLDDSLN